MAIEYMTTKVTVPHDSGLPRDSITNTWAWWIPDGVSVGTGVSSFTARLDAFYTSIINLLSTQMDWQSAVFDTYNMSDSEPRVPVNTATAGFGTPVTTGDDMPAEVAICLSFKKNPLSGQVARRQRGRVYIGPLQAVAGDAHLSTGMGSTIVTAAGTNILNHADSDVNYTWAVYSRSEHFGKDVGEPILPDDVPNNSLLPTAYVEVQTIWCDNDWDIQRRRGVGATTRSTVIKTV